MKIVHAGIFNDHRFGGDIVFHEGLKALGHELVPFDYRMISNAYSCERMNSLLIEKARNSDLVFIGKGEKIEPDTLAVIKKMGVPILLWYGDWRKTVPEWLRRLLPTVSFFFLSSAGEELRRYHTSFRPGRSAVYFNPCLESWFDDIPRKRSDRRPISVLFTGTNHEHQESERRDLIESISSIPRSRLYGFRKNKSFYFSILYRLNVGTYRRRVRGYDYAKAICNSKIGVSISAVNSVPMYTSDRLTHLACAGVFPLVRWFPKADLLLETTSFETFKTKEELTEKVGYFLKYAEEREARSESIKTEFVKRYNAVEMLKMMFEIMDSGKSDRYPWVEVL